MRIADVHWSPEFIVRMEESVLSDETIRNLVLRVGVNDRNHELPPGDRNVEFPGNLAT